MENLQVLKLKDYIFEIDGKDIGKSSVEYEFNELTITNFKVCIGFGSIY